MSLTAPNRMVARAADASRSEAPTIEALIEALDPEVRAAIDDVDRTLIALALQQSPWDRLRSASRMAQTLARIRDAIASQGGGLEQATRLLAQIATAIPPGPLDRRQRALDTLRARVRGHEP